MPTRFINTLSYRMSDLSALSALPDDARVWIHSAAAPMDETTQTALLDRLSTFIEGWTSHEHPVQGAATVLYDRFLVLAATRPDGEAISGCGIDDAAQTVEKAARALDIDWVPSLHVLYRPDEESVAAVPRPTFQDRIESGRITPDTLVFDPSVTTLRALRDGDFEQPARASWHARLFPDPVDA